PVSPWRTHGTPSLYSASRIRAVSSDASSPLTSVPPEASAASSRVRLEMLLEPGRTTVPDTARTGERSRCGVRPAMQLLSISGWKARSHPGLAQDAGVGEARFQRLGE